MIFTINCTSGNHSTASFSCFSALNANRQKIIKMAQTKYRAQVIDKGENIELIVFSENDCRSLVKAISELL